MNDDYDEHLEKQVTRLEWVMIGLAIFVCLAVGGFFLGLCVVVWRAVFQ